MISHTETVYKYLEKKEVLTFIYKVLEARHGNSYLYSKVLEVVGGNQEFKSILCYSVNSILALGPCIINPSPKNTGNR